MIIKKKYKSCISTLDSWAYVLKQFINQIVTANVKS